METGMYGQMQDEQDDMGSLSSGSPSTVKGTYRQTQGEPKNVGNGNSDLRTALGPPPPRGSNIPGESQFAVGEVGGDTLTLNTDVETTTAAGDHEEVGNAMGSESSEEFVEARPEQLSAAETGEETAASDLRGIAGFEDTAAGEMGEASVESALPEAGEAIDGGSTEFFPIIASLVPTLVSAAGPKVAKGLVSKLSPRAARLIKRIPPRAIGTAAKGVGKAHGTSNILSLIAKLLEMAQESPSQTGGESVGEVSEVFLQEAAAALEVIIGNDDRVQITTQTAKMPWRRICALRIQFPSGATYRGTGFLIGPRAVATAGHCVYLHDQGGWARKIEVIPGCNGSSRPFRSVEATTFRSVGGWVNGKKPENDYGCIILPTGAFAQNLGSFGFAAFDAPTLLAKPAVLAGYPGDKPFAEMWGMKRLIKTVTAKTLVYDIDTVGGQSGAPVYIVQKGQRYVVGIHNYGASSGNSATRVTQQVYQRLLSWSQIGRNQG